MWILESAYEILTDIHRQCSWRSCLIALICLEGRVVARVRVLVRTVIAVLAMCVSQT